MSHHGHCAVASSSSRLHTQWQGSAALTRTSRRASSSGTSWTGTGWRRPPSRSQGPPCRCRSPPGRRPWTHLERGEREETMRVTRSSVQQQGWTSTSPWAAPSNQSSATVTTSWKGSELETQKAKVCEMYIYIYPAWLLYKRLTSHFALSA